MYCYLQVPIINKRCSPVVYVSENGGELVANEMVCKCGKITKTRRTKIADLLYDRVNEIVEPLIDPIQATMYSYLPQFTN